MTMVISSGPQAGIPFTPVVDQGGSVTFNITRSHYSLDGKWCTYVYFLNITGTGTTNVNITVTLPFPAVNANAFSGFLGWYDASGPNTYAGGHTLQGTGTFAGIIGGTSPPGSYFGKQPNLPLGNGDVLAGTLIYEIA